MTLITRTGRDAEYTIPLLVLKVKVECVIVKKIKNSPFPIRGGRLQQCSAVSAYDTIPVANRRKAMDYCGTN